MPKKDQRTRWGLFLGVWTLVGLFFSAQQYIFARLYEKPMTWKVVLLSNLPDWYIWAAFSLLIVWLYRRFPLDREHWIRSLCVHLPASVLVALGNLALAVSSLFILVIVPAGEHSLKWFPVYQRNLFLSVHWYVLVYWAILGVCQGLDYYRKYREREKRATQLEAQLVQAQLQALKMQLHPHFLFNTLHSISALLHEDAEAADRMIARLGEFLRLTLEDTGQQEVTLQKELEFLKCYLDIERIRFQDRLTVRYDIDPETLDALVPNLMWQPIVENAIRHGIAPRSGAGCIELRSKRLGPKLQLQVKDDGPGLRNEPGSGGDLNEGVGLANTRNRLRQLYGRNHWLGLCNGLDKGLVVTLEIPFKQAGTAITEPVGEIQWN
jgi:two-component system, LytTR family, sensor kinase